MFTSSSSSDVLATFSTAKASFVATFSVLLDEFSAVRKFSLLLAFPTSIKNVFLPSSSSNGM